jgi:hypothetical protein
VPRGQRGVGQGRVGGHPPGAVHEQARGPQDLQRPGKQQHRRDQHDRGCRQGPALRRAALGRCGADDGGDGCPSSSGAATSHSVGASAVTSARPSASAHTRCQRPAGSSRSTSTAPSPSSGSSTCTAAASSRPAATAPVATGSSAQVSAAQRASTRLATSRRAAT